MRTCDYSGMTLNCSVIRCLSIIPRLHGKICSKSFIYSISPPSRSTLPPAAAANFVPAAAAAVEE